MPVCKSFTVHLIQSVQLINSGPSSPSREKSTDSEDLAGIALPVHSRKSDLTLEIVSLPADEAVLTRTNLTQLIEEERVERAAKVWQFSLVQVND